MTAIITTGSISRALQDGLQSIFGMNYNEYEMEWTKLFEKVNSEKNFEEDLLYYGTGLASLKPETAGIAYDQMGQAWLKRYVPAMYALGWIISEEAMADGRYPKLANQMATRLAFSARQTLETLGANIYNLGFSGTQLGADGQALFSTAHPLAKGGTLANKLSVDADLSETALEQLLLVPGGFVDDAGLRIAVKPVSLHVPYKLQYEAQRILGSTKQNDTANNAMNTMQNILPVYVNHYFTDDDAYFVRTDVPDGMKYIERKAPTLQNDTAEFETGNMRYKVSFRCAFGWSDPKSVVGSAGA